jgi:hypothetical protein
MPIQLLKEIAKRTVQFKLAECRVVKCRMPIQLLKEIARGTVRFKLAECCVIKFRVLMQILKSLRIKISKETERFKLVKMLLYQLLHARTVT